MPSNPVLAFLSVSFTLPVLYLVSQFSSSPARTPSPFPLDLPAISERHIVAIGDLHGSLTTTQRVLRLAGVINEDNGWALGEGAFVQTGDILDRGTDTIKLFEWFEELREDAHRHGGEMHSLLGNHEMMNALGDWRYVTKEDIASFGGIEKRREALATNGVLGSKWLANYSLTARVPINDPTSSTSSFLTHLPSTSSPFFSHSAVSFIHAGLPLTAANLTPYPSALNTLAHSFLQKALAAAPPPHPPYPFPGLPRSLTHDEAALWGGEGVFWYRGYALEDESPELCARAKEVCEKIGVRHLVMGHTPSFEGIQTKCNASIILIDTGISPAYGGPLSALSITTTLHTLDDEPASTGSEFRKRASSSPEKTYLKTGHGGAPRWLEREVVRTLWGERRERDGEDAVEIREVWREERVLVGDVV